VTIIELIEETDLNLPADAISEADALEIYGHPHFELEFPSPATGQQYCIRPKGWIGHIPVGDTMLVVHPKVPAHSVFAMLEVAYNLKSLKLPTGSTDIESVDDMIEIIVSLLSRQVLERIRKGLHQLYVDRTEDLMAVRGRIDPRRSATNLLRARPDLYCEYDELTPDHEDNQILFWTLFVAARLRLRRPEVRAQVRRAYRALAGTVTLERASAAECIRRLYTRLNEDYRPMHALCRLILQHTGPNVLRGENRFVPFEINMPLLFEQFVAAWMKSRLSAKFRLKAHHRAYLDEDQHLLFDIDLVVYEKSSGRALLVLDTKYKRDSFPSNPDIQQVVAYAVRVGARNTALVYPQQPATPYETKIGPIGVSTIGFDIGQTLDEAGADFMQAVEATLFDTAS
jgi:5-methylcytosine-specific restriction enzyme subunit McrC